LSLIRAVLFLVGGSRQVSGNDIPARIGRLATTSPVHLPYLVVLALVLFVVAWLYLARTRSGRYFYAVGSNPEGAAARGLPVTRVVIAAFALSGMIAGLAGLMYVARFGSVEPGSAGIGYELWAISAVVVGGTSILGGSGGAVHTFFGVLLIGVVSNGVTITGLSSAWQTVAQGAIILVAITADSAIRRSYAARRQHARRRLA
jgi:rhamnose transport system permease protein